MRARCLWKSRQFLVPNCLPALAPAQHACSTYSSSACRGVNIWAIARWVMRRASGSPWFVRLGRGWSRADGGGHGACSRAGGRLVARSELSGFRAKVVDPKVHGYAGRRAGGVQGAARRQGAVPQLMRRVSLALSIVRSTGGGAQSGSWVAANRGASHRLADRESWRDLVRGGRSGRYLIAGFGLLECCEPRISLWAVAWDGQDAENGGAE